jgi:hypothetical protein
VLLEELLEPLPALLHLVVGEGQPAVGLTDREDQLVVHRHPEVVPVRV